MHNIGSLMSYSEIGNGWRILTICINFIRSLEELERKRWKKKEITLKNCMPAIHFQHCGIETLHEAKFCRVYPRVHNSDETQLTHLKFCTHVNKHLVNNVWQNNFITSYGFWMLPNMLEYTLLFLGHPVLF